MSLYHLNAGPAEIIRKVQKDHSTTEQLTQNYSDILRLFGNRNWIKYNDLCKILSELSYHGFASLNNLQTLGEEYTGIIQVDQHYITLPHKIIQFIAIILEFGGEILFNKLLKIFENELHQNEDIVPEAKQKLLSFIKLVKFTTPYIKAIHQSIFYLNGGKYQLSKRFTGINYVLVRHWLKENQSTYGYKILGIFGFLQIVLSLIVNIREKMIKAKTKLIQKKLKNERRAIERRIETNTNKIQRKKCVLCLEPMEAASLTRCGHLFCWNCILDWLSQKSECPVCRETITKSGTVRLQNYI